MDRRPAGVVVLLLAAFVTVAVPAALSPGISGTGSALPLPAPPPPGSCITLGPNLSTIEPCTEQHQWEVAFGWPADSLDPASESATDCTAIGLDYTGVAQLQTIGDWSLITNLVSQLISAPAAERAGKRGWTACAVRPPSTQTWSGSLAALRSIGDRPELFGQCLDSVDVRIPVPCNLPHVAQLLGLALEATAGSTDDRTHSVDTSVKPQCSELVALLTGAADVTYGEQLGAVTDAWIVPARSSAAPAAAPFSARFGCSLYVTGDRLLVDSVIGLGNAPLPLG